MLGLKTSWTICPDFGWKLFILIWFKLIFSMSRRVVLEMFLWRCALFMLKEAHCVLNETEGNAKLIHYFLGNVLFPGKGCSNKAGGSVCLGVPASVGSRVILSPENAVCCLLFEALECNISLQPHSWPYYINSGGRMTMEIMAQNALLKPFKMDSIVHGPRSVFGTLPERVNGCCFQPNTGDSGATSNHQLDNVIKRLSPCSCQ